MLRLEKVTGKNVWDMVHLGLQKPEKWMVKN